MFAKQYKILAELLERSTCNDWDIIRISDFLRENFDNFDRKKFMLACGMDSDYSHDELLGIFFDQVDKAVNSSVRIIFH